MPADLFVYALVAAGLVFWLRNILGATQEDESDRPARNASKSLDKTARTSPDNADFALNDTPMTSQDRIIQLAQNPVGAIAVDNKTAENGLIEISKADKGFDIDMFMEGSQDAFAIIVEGFAQGDRDLLKGLLDKSVFDAFNGAIDEREKLEHTQETEIHSIKKAEVIEAKMDGKMAFITIRFRADETSVTRDETGNILEGHPDKTTEMRDIWTFGRNVKSRDPRWLVYETRGDFDGDNDLIPDTH